MGKATHDSSLTVAIDSLANGPWGVGRYGKQVVFVLHSAPGDRMNVQILGGNPRLLKARPLEILRPSPARREPPCPYYPRCGGCQWQHIRYEQQLASKEMNVRDCLQRIAKVADPPLKPILPSPREWRHRMRVQLHANQRKEVGLYSLFSRDVVPLDACLLLEEGVESLLRAVAGWVGRLQGQVETIDLRCGSEGTGATLDVQMVGVLGEEDEKLAADFFANTPSIGSLVLSTPREKRRWGEERFQVGPGRAFVQANRLGNDLLVREVLRLGSFTPRDRVIDLYCGSGNFSFPIAEQAGQVVGLDSDPAAISTGQALARHLGTSNLRFLCLPAERAERLLAEQFNKIVLDPPRSGAKSLVERLTPHGPCDMIYVSCDPATLARDLSLLTRRGYKLKEVQPLDLFPQTYHVEAIAWLTLAQ